MADKNVEKCDILSKNCSKFKKTILAKNWLSSKCQKIIQICLGLKK